MPIRFRKSVKIAPGTRLNLSKNGISAEEEQFIKAS